nr:hypothetical protein [Rubrivivax pictus]
MKNIDNKSIHVGKYRVSSLAHRLSDSRYAASVSIRSGEGSATHDRVMRFTPLFDDRGTAIRYALAQGRAWVDERHTRQALAITHDAWLQPAQ